MSEIKNIHDKLFKNVFENVDNTRAFLRKILPETLIKAIDFSKISIDFTDYVSKKFKEGHSDIIVKTLMINEKGKELQTDIYILVEHKSYKDEEIFIQLLLYMYLMWQKDLSEDKPLRVIIPLVFYHGKDEWDIPQSFADQFPVSDEIKIFLLGFSYVLFDTKNWNFREEKNGGLRDNVFLLTAVTLMKSAFNEDFESIREIFKFWHESGFIRERENMLFFLAYLSETKDIDPGKLKKIFEESKINGGEIMPTLAERLREEGRNEGKEKWMNEGRNEEKLETARRMLREDFTIEQIVKFTGLSEEQLKKAFSELIKY
ncbi:MAG: Rpn family recombination-promoting nuclease/putative transposase [Candidatus Aminicenantes bacterium]|nr:Rpn family recombination-promoting nuclease/putative transposase [Candidatus Aminicenantes bacterium]